MIQAFPELSTDHALWSHLRVVAPYFSKGKINYKKLNNIQKGDQSSVEAKRWVMNQNSEIFKERWKKLRPDMLKYCEYDTLSMVAIFQGLKEII